MIDPTQFRELIVRPTLQSMAKWSEASEALLMGTAMQESGLTYIEQIGGGGALGFFQMEPATHDDIWENYLERGRDDLARKVDTWASVRVSAGLVFNLAYATAMCRVHYLRVKDPLPHEKDIIGLAGYWKKFYNTEAGKGTINQFVENYERMLKAA
jgi:hypothetical protein